MFSFFRQSLVYHRAWIIPLLLLVLFFALRLPFITKEYAPEETAWIQAGRGVAATGFPWTYLGENNAGSWAYWKGPFFPWLLGFIFLLFGEYEYAARSIPLLFSAGQIILVFLLARKIWGDEKGLSVGAVAAFLLAIHPLAIQNAVQIDIDGSSVAFFALLVLYFSWLLVTSDDWRRRDAVAAFCSSAALFLVRFDTPLMIFFSLTLLSFLFGNTKRALRLVVLYGTAIVFVVIIIFLYSAAFGQFSKAAEPFYNLVIGTWSALLIKFGSASVATYHSRLYEVLPGIQLGPFAPIAEAIFPSVAFLAVVFVWTTIPLTLLFLSILIRAVLQKIHKEEGVAYLLLPALVMFFTFAFVAITFNYPRYIHTSLILMLIATAYIGQEWFSLVARHKKAAFIGALLLAFLLTLTPLKYLLFENRIRSGTIFTAIALGITYITSIVSGSVFSDAKKRNFLGASLVVAYVTFVFLLTAKDMQKPYSLNAYYGNYGFKEAGQYLKRAAKPSDIVVTIDAIGYYYGGRYYDANLFNPSTDGETDFVAIYTLPPGRFERLIGNMNIAASFGTVNIFKK